MRTLPSKIGRVHYAAPVPRGYSALLALHVARAAVDREDRGQHAGALWMTRHARHHMERADRGQS